MSKKKKNAKQGTYALCITAGTFLGLGLIPMFGNVYAPLIVGIAAGYGVAYYLTEKTNRKKS